MNRNLLEAQSDPNARLPGQPLPPVCLPAIGYNARCYCGSSDCPILEPERYGCAWRTETILKAVIRSRSKRLSLMVQPSNCRTRNYQRRPASAADDLVRMRPRAQKEN